METTSVPEPFTEPIPPLRRYAQTALRQIADTTPGTATVRTHAVFDRDNDHYMLVAEGWQGYRRVYRILAHLSIAEGVLHLYEDGTIDGIAARLREAGVPPEKIVCEWAVLPPVGSSQ